VSRGWPTPDLVGLSEAEARLIARDQRISLVAAERREDYDLEAGRVIEQQPAAGAMLPDDRTVRVAVSLGWPVAPRAVGEAAGDILETFTARHPDARVDLERRFLTWRPVGSVLSQHPDAGVKLGRDQRLALVVAAGKPPWIWAGLGSLLVVAAAAAVFLLRPRRSPGQPRGTGNESADWAEDTGGIHLRVETDLGVQAARFPEDDLAAPDRTEEGVHIRIVTDPGEQSVGPTDDEDR
jgi:hypothetical protein